MPMAVESWLSKVRSAMSSGGGSSNSPGNRKQRSSSVGILAFEVASLMSKLLQLWRAVGDAGVARLRQETIQLDGVRKVVSEDEELLVGLARAELLDELRAASESVAVLAARCADPALRGFSDSGHRWGSKEENEMEELARKMEKQVATTAALRRAMEELAEAEHGDAAHYFGGTTPRC